MWYVTYDLSKFKLSTFNGLGVMMFKVQEKNPIYRRQRISSPMWIKALISKETLFFVCKKKNARAQTFCKQLWTYRNFTTALRCGFWLIYGDFSAKNLKIKPKTKQKAFFWKLCHHCLEAVLGPLPKMFFWTPEVLVLQCHK